MKTDIILDIETVPLPTADILAALPPFDASTVKVPANYKKPETVSAFIEEERANHGKSIIDRAALSPRWGRIALIGYETHGETSQLTECGLAIAWRILADAIIESNARVIGYNIKGFDLSFMVRRSLALGIDVPACIWKPRQRFPWSDNVVDLMEVWQALTGSREHCRLNDVLAELGLPTKSHAGAEFPALWESNRDEARRYNERDLQLERMLAERLGV